MLYLFHIWLSSCQGGFTGYQSGCSAVNNRNKFWVICPEKTELNYMSSSLHMQKGQRTRSRGNIARNNIQNLRDWSHEGHTASAAGQGNFFLCCSTTPSRPWTRLQEISLLPLETEECCPGCQPPTSKPIMHRFTCHQFLSLSLTQGHLVVSCKSEACVLASGQSEKVRVWLPQLESICPQPQGSSTWKFS